MVPEIPEAWAVFNVAPEDKLNDPEPEIILAPQSIVPVTDKLDETDKPDVPRTNSDVPPTSAVEPLKIICPAVP